MLRPTRWWWGMMCVATLACGDEGPLAGPAVRAVARDLEFVLPGVREDLVLTNETFEDGSHSLQEAATGEQPAITETYTAPFIWTAEATGRFEEKDYHYSYGMTGWGSGYTMKPTLQVVADDNTPIPTIIGTGRSEDLFYPWRFRPTVVGSVPVGRSCGMRAQLHVDFEARLVAKILQTSREQTQRTSTAYAPICPSGSGGGGAGGSTGGTKITICTWEVWTDLDGNIYEVFLLGCHSYTVPNEA